MMLEGDGASSITFSVLEAGPEIQKVRPGRRCGLRTPATKPMNSVCVRKPPGLKLRKGGPDAGAVCVRRPAKSMNSVFVRKLPDLKFRKGGPGAGAL